MVYTESEGKNGTELKVGKEAECAAALYGRVMMLSSLESPTRVMNVPPRSIEIELVSKIPICTCS